MFVWLSFSPHHNSLRRRSVTSVGLLWSVCFSGVIRDVCISCERSSKTLWNRKKGSCDGSKKVSNLLCNSEALHLWTFGSSLETVCSVVSVVQRRSYVCMRALVSLCTYRWGTGAPVWLSADEDSQMTEVWLDSSLSSDVGAHYKRLRTDWQLG